MRRLVIVACLVTAVVSAYAADASPTAPVVSPAVAERLAAESGELAPDSLVIDTPLPVKSLAGLQRWGTRTPDLLALSVDSLTKTDTLTLFGLAEGTAVLTAWRYVTRVDTVRTGNSWKPKIRYRVDSLFNASEIRVVPYCRVLAVSIPDSATVQEGDTLPTPWQITTACGVESGP